MKTEDSRKQCCMTARLYDCMTARLYDCMTARLYFLPADNPDGIHLNRRTAEQFSPYI